MNDPKSTLQFWNDLNKSGGIDEKIFAKLIQDQKLPVGSIQE